MMLVKQDIRRPCYKCGSDYLRATVYTGKFDGRVSSEFMIVYFVDWCLCGHRSVRRSTTEFDDFSFFTRCLAPEGGKRLCSCHRVNGVLICEQVKQFVEKGIER